MINTPARALAFLLVLPALGQQAECGRGPIVVGAQDEETLDVTLDVTGMT